MGDSQKNCTWTVCTKHVPRVQRVIQTHAQQGPNLQQESVYRDWTVISFNNPYNSHRSVNLEKEISPSLEQMMVKELSEFLPEP